MNFFLINPGEPYQVAAAPNQVLFKVRQRYYELDTRRKVGVCHYLHPEEIEDVVQYYRDNWDGRGYVEYMIRDQTEDYREQWILIVSAVRN